MLDILIATLGIVFVLFYVYKIVSNRKKNNMKIRPLGWSDVSKSNIRPLGWIIIIFNIFWIYRLLKGLYNLGLSGNSSESIGLTAVFFIIIWLLVSMAINVILYVIYRVTKKKDQRLCPACGVEVAVGQTVCSKCNFDFAKAAGA